MIRARRGFSYHTAPSEVIVSARWFVVVVASAVLASAAHADVDLAVHGGTVRGTYSLKAGGVDAGSTGTGTHGSLGFDETYRVSPRIAIGLVQRLTFGVAEDINGDSATELDLAVRLMSGHTYPNRTFLYGLGDVGYSRLFMPDTAAALKPSGLIVGFGGGFRFPLYGRAFFGMSVGAQFGFQGGELSDGGDYTLSTTLYHGEAFVGVRL